MPLRFLYIQGIRERRINYFYSIFLLFFFEVYKHAIDYFVNDQMAGLVLVEKTLEIVVRCNRLRIYLQISVNTAHMYNPCVFFFFFSPLPLCLSQFRDFTIAFQLRYDLGSESTADIKTESR